VETKEAALHTQYITEDDKYKRRSHKEKKESKNKDYGTIESVE